MKKSIFILIQIHLILLCFTSKAQTQDKVLPPNPNKYNHAFRFGGIAGSGFTLGGMNGFGAYYYLRSLKTFSLVPAIGITYLNYSVGDEYSYTERNGIGLETSVGANLQIARIAHLRFTPHIGYQRTSDYKFKPSRSLSYGAYLGTGLSLWKIDADFDVGFGTYFNTNDAMFIGRLSLGYIFTQNKKFFP